MKLSGHEVLSATQAQAWEALNDTEMLKAAISGCESLQPEAGSSEPHRYELLMAVSIGPVKARFKGRLQLSELQPPHSYRLSFDGQGGAAGHGKGTAQVRLEAQPDAADGRAQTLLHYEVEASVGGKIAQIGSRLVDLAAQKLAQDFFAAFNTALQQRYPAAQLPTAPAQSEGAAPKSRFQRLLDWYLGWLGSIFKPPKSPTN